MQIVRHLLFAAFGSASLLMLCGIAPVHAAVEVTFVHPERYADTGLYRSYGPRSADVALREIRTYLECLGARHLAPGERLAIEVLDVDLAGRFEPWRPHAYDVRILREVTWPRIELRYRLQRKDGTVTRAQETIADLNYLMNASSRYSRDTLPYEKAMLENWFRARFVRPEPPAG